MSKMRSYRKKCCFFPLLKIAELALLANPFFSHPISWRRNGRRHRRAPGRLRTHALIDKFAFYGLLWRINSDNYKLNSNMPSIFYCLFFAQIYIKMIERRSLIFSVIK